MRIKFMQSPFFDTRRKSTRMLIIHHTGSYKDKINDFAGTIKWFTDINTHARTSDGNIIEQVSAHYAIPIEPYNNFDAIQFVREEDVAYHAGKSNYKIDKEIVKFVNRHSIGIELQGDGDLFEYTDYQYNILTDLTVELLERHPDIRMDLIVGHSDVAPKRKTDPGKKFQWKRYLSAVSIKVEEALLKDKQLEENLIS